MDIFTFPFDIRRIIRVLSNCIRHSHSNSSRIFAYSTFVLIACFFSVFSCFFFPVLVFGNNKIEHFVDNRCGDWIMGNFHIHICHCLYCSLFILLFLCRVIIARTGMIRKKNNTTGQRRPTSDLRAVRSTHVTMYRLPVTAGTRCSLLTAATTTYLYYATRDFTIFTSRMPQTYIVSYCYDMFCCSL